MSEIMKLIEEALLNSIPAQQTVLLEGWILRLNQNYTYRASCVYPLNYTDDINVADKIKMCEELFHHNEVPSVFKVTPALQENLSEILLSLNYQKIKTVNVMRLALSDSIKELRPEVNYSEIPGEECLPLPQSLPK